ncbi:hypothetical protein CLU79DRAFT_518445 [Phycomyces nitens]|nr:hypothetical protein CLU79DRAFT_518445 [Phycomyces nitens]
MPSRNCGRSRGKGGIIKRKSSMSLYLTFPSTFPQNIICYHTMDLSWCIICDCHCVEDNLYCSDNCRNKDTSQRTQNKTSSPAIPLSPPSSPLLEPFLSSFHSHRTKSVARSFGGYITPPNSPESVYFDR